MTHFGERIFPPGIFRQFTTLGLKGVQLFYFISAFTLFLSSKSRLNHEVFPVRFFFIRRFFRIAPMYYFALIYYAIIIPVFSQQNIFLTGIILNVTFTHGFSPFYINNIVPGGWSIAVEMLFYLFVPFLVVKVNSLKKAMIFFVICCLIKLFCNGIFIHNPFSIQNGLWTGYVYRYLPNHLPSFAYGILFYFISVDTEIRLFFKKNFGFIISVFFILSFLLVIDYWKLELDLCSPDFFSGLLFLFVAILTKKYNFKIIVNKLTRYIGTLSYSMYLVHFTVIYWVFKFHVVDNVSHNQVLTFLVGYLLVVGLTVGISNITYNFIEIRFLNYAKLLINRITVRSIPDIEPSKSKYQV